jgi:6-phosphofructokinase 1
VHTCCAGQRHLYHILVAAAAAATAAVRRINMLFVIGGQGGNQLGAQLAEGCQRRRIPCCIVGVPKSIDNDVMLMDKTFGFDTVVQVSCS